MQYKSFDELPSTLNADVISDYLGISRSGSYNLLRSKGFPTLMVGKRMIVQKERFRIWCDEHIGYTGSA